MADINDAKRDGNYVTSMLFKGSDGLTYPVEGDEVTGRLLVDSTGGGSGTVTTVSVVTANGVSGSVANATTTPAITLTLGAITPSSVTGRIIPRVTTIVSSATPTINTDNCDCVTITALATAITSMTTNLSGTPNNFDKLTFRIKDNGTARGITWGASFAAMGVSLPTTTVISKVLTVGFIWDSVAGVWGCVASAQEA